MSCFHDFHLAIERIPVDCIRVMSDQIGTCLKEFLQRRWLVGDGFVASRASTRYGVEWDADIVVDEATGTYCLHWPDSSVSIAPKPLEEVMVYVPVVARWIEDLTRLFGFEASKQPRQPELISDHFWHLGDLRAPKSSRWIPIYLARQFLARKEMILEALENRLRPDGGIVLLAHRECIPGPLPLPRGHQLASLDQMLSQDGQTLDPQVLQRLTLQTEPVEGGAHFDVRSGALMLAHFKHPRVFNGLQKGVIALLWKYRGIDALKWADIRQQTGCGKDPRSVFGKDWSELLERRGAVRGRYRLRTPKN